jgi:hypothetical protein
MFWKYPDIHLKLKVNFVFFSACLDWEIVTFLYSTTLTPFKLCTVVMDILKMWMWRFGSGPTLFEEFRYTGSWSSFFQHYLNGWYLLCVIISSNTLYLIFSKRLQILWTHWKCAYAVLESLTSVLYLYMHQLAIVLIIDRFILELVWK